MSNIRFGDFTWLADIFSPTPQQHDHAALLKMHERATALFNASPLGDSESISQFVFDTTKDIIEAVEYPLSKPHIEAAYLTVKAFADHEPTLFSPPPPLPGRDAMNLQDERDLRDHLQRQLFQLDDLERQSTDWRQITSSMIVETFSELSQHSGSSEISSIKLSSPLISMVDDPAALVRKLLGFLECDSARQAKLFQDIYERFFHNLLAVNRITMQEFQERPKLMRLTPDELMAALVPTEAVEKIFDGTPMRDLLLCEVPLPIPEETRFEHMHIVAGTGHGKTQTLQHLIVQDLQRPAQEIPSMVILDSQGDMLNKLQRLALFDPMIENSLARRLLIVDPSDVEFAPSLNLFDIQSERLQNYNQRDREQILAGIIEIYDYIFGGLLGAELTQKQDMVFRFLAQLMLSIPGATIHTLRDLLIDASPYMQYVEKLPATSRDFFETQFFQHGYKGTREQILRRLYGVLQNPSFERMFASPKNRLDLFDVLNTGGIVLVNTAKDFMKTEASSIFGRYIIALTFKAAMERAILPEHQRHPTFLWIDEASEYFDGNIDNLLIQARKYKLGLVMAHQYLGQLPKGLPASIMTNTSIKLAGGTSHEDAIKLSREMRTTPEFVNAMTKQHSQTNFATFVRNVTPQAMKLSIPFGTLENMPRMPNEHFQVLLNASRKRLSPEPVEPTVQKPTSDVTPTPAPTIPLPDDDEYWQSY